MCLQDLVVIRNWFMYPFWIYMWTQTKRLDEKGEGQHWLSSYASSANSPCFFSWASSPNNRCPASFRLPLTTAGFCLHMMVHLTLHFPNHFQIHSSPSQERRSSMTVVKSSLLTYCLRTSFTQTQEPKGDLGKLQQCLNPFTTTQDNCALQQVSQVDKCREVYSSHKNQLMFAAQFQILMHCVDLQGELAVSILSLFCELLQKKGDIRPTQYAKRIKSLQ